MKRLTVRIITLICFLLFLTCIGTDARSEAMEQIDAYLKKNTTIIYNGGTVPQTDKNGKSLFPIVYDGKTYLSIEAVANTGHVHESI